MTCTINQLVRRHVASSARALTLTGLLAHLALDFGFDALLQVGPKHSRLYVHLAT